jgi:hypothetical protein
MYQTSACILALEIGTETPTRTYWRCRDYVPSGSGCFGQLKCCQTRHLIGYVGDPMLIPSGQQVSRCRFQMGKYVHFHPRTSLLHSRRMSYWGYQRQEKSITMKAHSGSFLVMNLQMPRFVSPYWRSSQAHSVHWVLLWSALCTYLYDTSNPPLSVARVDRHAI